MWSGHGGPCPRETFQGLISGSSDCTVRDSGFQTTRRLAGIPRPGQAVEPKRNKMHFGVRRKFRAEPVANRNLDNDNTTEALVNESPSLTGSCTPVPTT